MKPRVFPTLRFLGSFLALACAAGLATWILGLRAAQAWPFLLGAAGAAGLHSGMRKRSRFSADYVVPSMAFLLLSGFFCLFSFRIIPMRLKDFVLSYWVAIPIVSIVLLVLGAGLSRRSRAVKAREGEDN